MDPNINPQLAADLSKVSDEKVATDLSKSAIEARRLKRRFARAADEARAMSRTFKGIAGAPNRREHVLNALKRHDISLDDVEKMA